LSSELAFRMKLIEYEYMLKRVRVMVVRDAGEIIVDNETIPLQKGVEIEIPLWLAQVLEKEGLVNPIEPPMSIEDIARVHFSVISARTPADLEPLPKNFYLETMRYIKMLDEQIRKEFRAELLEEKQKAVQYVLEIMDRRLLLILQSMRSPTSLAEISSKLSEEEAVLLEELRSDIETWRSRLMPPA
jgi:DNA replication factor GINS